MPVGQQKSFFQYRQESHHKNLEFSMDLTLRVPDAPPGDYVVEYTIHDATSGEASSFRQDFQISE